MSQFSLEFYKSFADTMEVNGTSASIDFSQCGYLFLVGESGTNQLKANHKQQTALGVEADLLDRTELASRFPSLSLNGVALGCFSAKDGTLNTMLALTGFRQKAESLGVQFIANRVIELECSNHQVQSVKLADGQEITADIFRDANQTLSSYFDGYFNRTVRPLISNIIPLFKEAKCTQTWTGHYAQNGLDGNMIFGNWPKQAENFYVACGFSGHGVMHAPAVGMAMAELVINGRFSTFDLSRMSYQRVLHNQPYREQGII